MTRHTEAYATRIGMPDIRFRSKKIITDSSALPVPPTSPTDSPLHALSRSACRQTSRKRHRPRDGCRPWRTPPRDNPDHGGPRVPADPFLPNPQTKPDKPAIFPTFPRRGTRPSGPRRIPPPHPTHRRQMSYQVFARKYRPRTFADILGQDHVVQTLKNASRS